MQSGQHYDSRKEGAKTTGERGQPLLYMTMKVIIVSIFSEVNDMAELAHQMPPLIIPIDKLKEWGTLWLGNQNPVTKKSKQKECFDRFQSVNFAAFIDAEFGACLAKMLGNIKVLRPKGDALIPPAPDCVEVGGVRIIGGVRPQNFDVAYRPDGPKLSLTAKH